MKHSWFAFRHRKKTGNLSLLFIKVISYLFLLQKEEKSIVAKKIVDNRTQQFLHEVCYKNIQNTGVAE